MSDYEEGLLDRIAELEAAVRTAANACLSETARAEKAETELAWWERNFLTADGDDVPTKLRKLEAELAGHKARLAAINIYGDADIAAFKWQARAEKAEAELAEVRTVADASERNHATQFDRVVAEKHDLEAEVERLQGLLDECMEALP